MDGYIQTKQQKLNDLVKQIQEKTKECPHCHQFFPLTEEYFYKSKNRKSSSV